MGNKKNKRRFKQTRKQHLKNLKRRNITARLLSPTPPWTPPPPLPLPPPNEVTPPAATSTPSSSASCILASAINLECSAESEQNLVKNETEFMMVERNRFLQWVNSFARCECGERMNVTMKSECGMAKAFEAECGLCSEKSTLYTSPGGAHEQKGLQLVFFTLK